MPESFAGLQTNIDNLDVTSDNLVTLATLETVLASIKALMLQMGIRPCADLAELATVAGTEANTCFVTGKGFYTFSAGTPPGGSTPALGSGYWQRRNTGVVLADVADMAITNPADAEVLRYNASTGHWENGSQTVSGIGWNGVSGKPFTNDATNPTTAGILKAAAGLQVNTNKLTVDGNGNTVVAGTLGVTGDSTFTRIIATGSATLQSISASSNVNVGGTLGITGNMTAGGTLGVTGTTTAAAINASGDVRVGTNRIFLTAAGGTIDASGRITGSTIGANTFSGVSIAMTAVVFAGAWQSAFRPTPPSNEIWIGFNITTGVWESWNGSAWANV